MWCASLLGIMSRYWMCRATIHASAQQLLQLLLMCEKCNVCCINQTLAMKTSKRLAKSRQVSWSIRHVGNAMSAALVKVFQKEL